MRGRLAAGDNLILFPEGTTSDGSRVMPFRSTFFAIAEGDASAADPAGLGGLRPAGRAADRTRQPAAVRLVRRHGPRLALLAAGAASRAARHRPAACRRWIRHSSPTARRCLTPSGGAVADGAATLRQNRPAQPISVPAQVAPTIGEPHPPMPDHAPDDMAGQRSDLSITDYPGWATWRLHVVRHAHPRRLPRAVALDPTLHAAIPPAPRTGQSRRGERSVVDERMSEPQAPARHHLGLPDERV